MTINHLNQQSLDVGPLRNPERPDLLRLFLQFPHRHYQQIVQRLDRDRLADFLTSNYQRLLEMEGARHFGAWRGGSRLTGIAVLIPSDWHSEVYGIRMGKIVSFLNPEDRDAGAPLLQRVMDEARDMGYRHISTRLDGRDQPNLLLFAQSGFYMVDCSVKLSLDLKLNTPRRRDLQDLKIVPYQESHLPTMREIAATAHEFNHFYNDPALPQERTRELFRQWVERCCRELGVHIIVAIVENEVAGFCVFLENQHFNESLGRKVGILDFICLDAQFQGQGLGTSLMNQALYQLRKTYDLIELRTNFTNYPALNLYSRFGFKIVASDVFYHRLV